MHFVISPASGPQTVVCLSSLVPVPLTTCPAARFSGKPVTISDPPHSQPAAGGPVKSNKQNALLLGLTAGAKAVRGATGFHLTSAVCGVIEYLSWSEAVADGKASAELTMLLCLIASGKIWMAFIHTCICNNKPFQQQVHI